LFYDIYSRDQLVTGGRVLVEVGPGKLVSVAVSPHEMTGSTRSLHVRTETQGTGDARLTLNLDGELFYDETISLKGFEVLT
jgi:hypothetical protein